jgi:hypothetical protein
VGAEGRPLAAFRSQRDAALDGRAVGASNGACAGNDEIRIEAAKDLAFLMRPKEPGFVASAGWIAELSPRAFASVTLEQSKPAP